jgi:hypothetical protein
VKNQDNKAAPFTALDKQSKYSSYINGQFTDKLLEIQSSSISLIMKLHCINT